ncbi:MAG: DUF2142 domain-containing protein [Gammaproteobacteria bacterium]
MSVSKHACIWSVLLLIFNGLFFSSIIPPFQSPDEFQHLERAYLLTQGNLLLDSPPGVDSGGMMDTGLLDYMQAYGHLPFKPDVKLMKEEMKAAKEITWTGKKVFESSAGSAYYFPLIYLPQATGLMIGEELGLTLATSYELARYSALAFIAVVLFLAFRIYAVNPLLLALVFIPMSVFQFSSASLDGVSTALSIFALSIFLKFMMKKSLNPDWLFYVCTVAILLVVTCRIHLMPMLLLPFVMALYSKSKTKFAVSVIATLLVGAWIYIVMTHNTHNYIQNEIGSSSKEVVFHYVLHPWAFFVLVFQTIGRFFYSYATSFLGVLGWLDTIFPRIIYFVLASLMVMIAGFSISFKTEEPPKAARWVLVLISLASILLMFFIFLIMWNPHPAQVIEGVQGRYFLVPCMMMAYACCGIPSEERGYNRWAIAFWLVLLLEGVTLVSTAQVLIGRYYASMSDIFLNF